MKTKHIQNIAKNQGCLMYWATESSQGMINLVNISSAPKLTANVLLI
ncbi:hypothetical protein [Oceanihabitans sediminis]|nr:hypothetical protein [Oceanihabitans sediminis]MDX1278874.1 hypothetical protein [Oceanihabitans sediminis]